MTITILTNSDYSIEKSQPSDMLISDTHPCHVVRQTLSGDERGHYALAPRAHGWHLGEELTQLRLGDHRAAGIPVCIGRPILRRAVGHPGDVRDLRLFIGHDTGIVCRLQVDIPVRQ